MSKQCPPCDATKICNPPTGRCVLKTGPTGKALLAKPEKKEKVASNVRCPPCDPTKMCNPASGRCVLKTGPVGMKLLGTSAAPKTEKKTAPKTEKKTAPKKTEKKTAKNVTKLDFDWNISTEPKYAMVAVSHGSRDLREITAEEWATPIRNMKAGDKVELPMSVTGITATITTPTLYGLFEAIYTATRKMLNAEEDWVTRPSKMTNIKYKVANLFFAGGIRSWATKAQRMWSFDYEIDS
jgi:hypothetical protein